MRNPGTFKEGFMFWFRWAQPDREDLGSFCGLLCLTALILLFSAVAVFGLGSIFF